MARVALGIHGRLRDRSTPQRGTVLALTSAMLDKGSGTDRVWREDIYWSDVQPTEGGAYDWTIPDAIVKAATDAGFRVWAVLNHSPAWATAPGGTDEDAWPCPPYPDVETAGGESALDAYAAFCAAAAARYARSGEFWDTYAGTARPVTHFEVWNEEYTALGSKRWDPVAEEHVDPWYSSAELYAQIYNVAAPAISGAALFATPVAALALKTWNSFPVGSEYLDVFLSHLLVPLTAVSVHPYTENYYAASYVPPSSSDRWKYFTQVADIREKMVTTGRASTTIWITEIGWPSRAGQLSEEQQALRFSDLWTAVGNLGFVRGLFLYTSTNPDAPDNSTLPGYLPPNNPNSAENYYALWHTGALVGDIGSAKPAVTTITNLPSILIGGSSGGGSGPQPVGPCVHPDHFSVVDGEIRPQPWMQLRRVGGVSGESKTASYGVAGGGNKNDLIHTLSWTWTNNTPIPQWFYGLVTRGGVRVALQARSRAFLQLWHGLAAGSAVASSALVEVSRVGCGLDVGMGGVLGTQTDFGVSEVRQNSHTMPLMPQLTGWREVLPGQTVTARVDLRFRSEYWEAWLPESGADGSESSYTSGETRLDLYAVPKL